MTRQPIQIIQGGQYGSEAKGAVAAHLCLKEDIDIAVRTGATNAGHTVYYRGKKFTMQQLPTGWVNPDTKLVIGAGALVDPLILDREIETIESYTGLTVQDRLFVDPRAYTHWPWHAKASRESGRHAGIGATGKGCSEAIISRLRLRGEIDYSLGAQIKNLSLSAKSMSLLDTEKLLNDAWDSGAKIQLEGTQGQELDLCLGPYPYVTHKQTGPAQWMLECGLSPGLPTDIVMVIRTYPIRVAGNSGPLPMETSWPHLLTNINSVRQRHRLPDIVPASAIDLFRQALDSAAPEFHMPPYPWTAHNQHNWPEDIRLTYRHALSNLNSEALRCLDEQTLGQLTQVMEMTTVTKKLRRIALMDWDILERAARQIRPNRVVVTFVNYLLPQYWGNEGAVSSAEMNYLKCLEDVVGAPVSCFNRGPLPEHFIDVPSGEIE